MSDQMVTRLRKMPKCRRDALQKGVMAITNGAPMDALGWRLYREKWMGKDDEQRIRMK